MNKNELNEHEYQCGSKTMKCEICGENVIKTTYDLHLEYECKKNNEELNSSDKKDENKIKNICDKNKNKKEKENKLGNKKRKRNEHEDNKDKDDFDFDEYKAKKKKYY